MLGAGTQARHTAIKEDLQLRSDDPKPIVSTRSADRILQFLRT